VQVRVSPEQPWSTGRALYSHHLDCRGRPGSWLRHWPAQSSDTCQQKYWHANSTQPTTINSIEATITATTSSSALVLRPQTTRPIPPQLPARTTIAIMYATRALRMMPTRRMRAPLPVCCPLPAPSKSRRSAWHISMRSENQSLTSHWRPAERGPEWYAHTDPRCIQHIASKRLAHPGLDIAHTVSQRLRKIKDVPAELWPLGQ